MEWIKPQDKLPPQGKKILAFFHGDIYVVQRFGKYWFSIPFYDSKYSYHEEPSLWADIFPPNDITGKMHVLVEGDKMYDIDSLEKEHPDVYEDLIEGQKSLWGIE